MFRWLALLLVLSQPALAAELTLELPSGSRSWTTEQLLARPDVREVTIDNDTAYKHKTVYRAVPLASLLEGIRPGDHLQVVALDGFVAEQAAAPLLATSGSRAWLAIEDPANPWPPLGEDKPSAGPFFLVWTDPQIDRIVPEQWPYQIATIRRLPPVAERFPALLPAAEASADVQAGFAQFQKNCLACHRLNRQGDAQFGPDLNVPYNPIEYLQAGFLKRLIRNPQDLRHWPQARMPAFAETTLSDTELDQLIAYLTHMAGRKVQ